MTDKFRCPDCDRAVPVGDRIEVIGAVGETYYECPRCGVTSIGEEWRPA